MAAFCGAACPAGGATVEASRRITISRRLTVATRIILVVADTPMRRMTRRGIAVLPVLLMCGACVMLAAAAMTTGAASQANRGGIAELVPRITRDTKWTLAASIPIAFPTYHPQGMVRI